MSGESQEQERPQGDFIHISNPIPIPPKAVPVDLQLFLAVLGPIKRSSGSALYRFRPPPLEAVIRLYTRRCSAHRRRALECASGWGSGAGRRSHTGLLDNARRREIPGTDPRFGRLLELIAAGAK